MLRPLITLTGLLLTTSATAEALNSVHFSGFGTLGAAYSTNEKADYISAYEQSQGVGRSHRKDYGLDTVFGVQADGRLSKTLSATAQMQSRRLADGTSTPYFEWAFAKIEATDDLSLRLGRVVTPMFMVSESRAIGYAQTSARLPGEVYLLNPITYVDGGGITQRFAVGDTLLAANATTGKLEQTLPTIFGDIDVDYDASLVNLSAEQGHSQMRLGIARADIDFNNDTLDLLVDVLALLSDASVSGAARLHELAPHRDFAIDFYDIGYQFDNGEWQLQAEYVVRRSESYIVTDNDAFFVQAARRLGNWTPYLRYSHANSTNDRSEVPTLDASATGNDLFIALAGAVNGYGVNLKTFDERKSYTAGTRWDFADNYALKFQMDHVTKPAGSATLFVNFTDEFRDTRQQVNVYAMTLDFIF